MFCQVNYGQLGPKETNKRVGNLFGKI